MKKLFIALVVSFLLLGIAHKTNALSSETIESLIKALFGGFIYFGIYAIIVSVKNYNNQ